MWIFDLKTRKGRKLAIPGITFANDPAIRGNVLYVSDNVADQLYSVEPADFRVVPEANGYLVIVPDLVKGELRMIRLGK